MNVVFAHIHMYIDTYLCVCGYQNSNQKYTEVTFANVYTKSLERTHAQA